MMIKVGDEYLDFDENIFVEKRAKLFENITSNNGDFSYEFNLPPTSNNKKILGVQDVNTVDKSIYNNMDAVILSGEGVMIYSGFLRVETQNNESITASFFSGNTNWVAKLPILLSDIDMSNYNVKLTSTLSPPSTDDITDGILFPYVDNGLLDLRKNSPAFSYDDLYPWIYVKTVVKEIFKKAGIKVSGDILSDPIYDRLITTNGNNEWIQGFINDRTIHVGKIVDQSVTAGVYNVVSFPDDTFPKFIGNNNNFSTSTNRYTADVGMYIELEFFLYTDNLFTADSGIFINGVSAVNDYQYTSQVTGTDYKYNYPRIFLNAGDYIELRMRPLANATIFSNSYLKITPTKFDTIYANSILPDWECNEFLDEVFKLFNTIIDYDEFSSTITISLFSKISKKEVQDLSIYFDSVEKKEYYELIDNYGKLNSFGYNQNDSDFQNDYNRRNDTEFAGGSFTLNSKYIEPSAEILKSQFTAAINYDHENFKNIMRVDLLSSEISEDLDITVTASGSIANFTTSDLHYLQIGDVVRLSDMANENYSGDGVVYFIPSTTEFLLLGFSYNGNDTGKANRLIFKTESNGPYLSITNHVSSTSIGLDGSYAIITEELGYQLFNQLNYAWVEKKIIGYGIDDVYGGLSFGDISLNNYTVTINMIDRYFAEFKKVLQDPIKVYVNVFMPDHIFKSIVFNRPIKISSIDVNSIFYLNAISGYTNSYTPCTLELIKLSV